MLYLIHFQKKFKHAQHYRGFCEDGTLERRMAKHKSGKGARLIRVIQEAGIKWECVATFAGDRKDERKMKKVKVSKLCPICSGKPVRGNTLTKGEEMTVTTFQERLFDFFRGTADRIEVTITTMSPAEMRKTDNPFVGRRVEKYNTLLVRLNYDYEKEVQEMRKEEGVKGKFRAKERAWGTHVEGCPLIEHKGSHYLDCQVISATDPIYYLDGKEMTKDEKKQLKKFLPEKKEDSGRQKTDEAVVVRTIRLDSIIHVLLPNGEEIKP